jgi:plasmid stability protein
MVSLTIRNVPEDVRNELGARAASSGRSMQEYVLAALADIASRPTPATALAEIRRRARAYPPLDPATILADIDADRR